MVPIGTHVTSTYDGMEVLRLTRLTSRHFLVHQEVTLPSLVPRLGQYKGCTGGTCVANGVVDLLLYESMELHLIRITLEQLYSG